jgi:predicted DNA-binding transcriptional regulator AlpA
MTPNQPDTLISLTDLMKLICVSSRTTIYRYLDENPDFPRPCKIGGRRGRMKFKAAEVARFIDSLEARR